MNLQEAKALLKENGYRLLEAEQIDINTVKQLFMDAGYEIEGENRHEVRLATSLPEYPEYKVVITIDPKTLSSCMFTQSHIIDDFFGSNEKYNDFFYIKSEKDVDDAINYVNSCLENAVSTIDTKATKTFERFSANNTLFTFTAKCETYAARGDTANIAYDNVLKKYLKDHPNPTKIPHVKIIGSAIGSKLER